MGLSRTLTGVFLTIFFCLFCLRVCFCHPALETLKQQSIISFLIWSHQIFILNVNWAKNTHHYLQLFTCT